MFSHTYATPIVHLAYAISLAGAKFHEVADPCPVPITLKFWLADQFPHCGNPEGAADWRTLFLGGFGVAS